MRARRNANRRHGHQAYNILIKYIIMLVRIIYTNKRTTGFGENQRDATRVSRYICLISPIYVRNIVARQDDTTRF